MSDQTAISELTPKLTADIDISQRIMSQRFQGSFQLILRKISRLPSYNRLYTKGDPVQLIDWKAFARNDQLIVREDRDEASSRIMICLDCSDTLFWPEDALLSPKLIKKWEITCRIAFHLAYIHLKKGDTVHFLFLDQTSQEPTLSIRWESAQEVINMFSSLESSHFNLDILLARSQALAGTRKYHWAYLLSDFLNHSHETWLQGYASMGRVFHILSSKEVKLDWLTSGSCYYDETGDKKEFLGAKLKGSSIYQKTLDEWREKIIKMSQKINFDYHLITDQTPLSHYLQTLSTTINGGR